MHREDFLRIDRYNKRLYGLLLLELALAADRIFMLDEPDETVHIALSELNFGALPMGNNPSRLASRFYGDESAVDAVRELQGQQISTLDAL